ncbi:ShlB/FhaC/HecB family hemolysin secretion/activation protein [Acinetobacter vivianii]|uniref:ShlB/FhaC/HecB family hemolysin secretion/activation protein n=1 Tax=Acinetobacter vivianii TaxID=1776742 RepID=UPI002DBAEBE8|nr:ShlB/FhaC/HecB family hemolysin secretion/activation protein [Acinetobacter vivianii]MEB6479372.1 ShlB/FhaC/HecB family hemolysin secretion/activation protein [Acinetobacter vivianii]MEB6656797.1 ShlB/FhaC/HecB family hemolysin secretion/activation protein [Acinetobacter vivianii]
MCNRYFLLLLILHSGFSYAEEQVSKQQTRDYLAQKQQIDQLTQSVAPFIQLQQAKVDSSFPWLQKEPICFGISTLDVDVPPTHPSIKTADFNRIFKELKYSDNKVLGRCIGEKGLAGVVNYINEQLVQLGYVSTQVIVPEQDLSAGHLRLSLIPGLIGEIRLKNSKNKSLNYSLPMKAGDILNIRKLEQILESFARLQGMQANFDILPSQKSSEDAGYSDVEIIWEIQEKNFITVGLNDAGSKSSGKYQGYASYALENPFNAADSLFVYYTKSINDWNVDHTDFNNFFASYEVPYQNWLFNLNASQYTNIQELEGFDKWLDYKTINKDFNFQVQRELSRSKTYRLSGYAQLYRKSVSSFIDDLELMAPRKRLSGWELGSKYQYRFGQQTLNAQFSYRKGADIFGKNEAAEDFTGEGDSHAGIWNAAVQYAMPWQTTKNSFMYQLNWQGQWSPQKVVSQESFNMGGRYSIRGYRSEQSMSGNNGHCLQQTVHWLNPIPNFSFYAGLDQGLVTGEGTQYFSDRYLLGSVIGLRTQFKHLNGDFFVGRGLVAPRHIRKDVITGFNLSFNY